MEGTPVFLRAPVRTRVVAVPWGLAVPDLIQGGGCPHHSPLGHLTCPYLPCTEVPQITVWEGPFPRGGSSLTSQLKSRTLCHPA